MNATDLHIHEINRLKGQPRYLRRLADGHDELGNDMTAADLRRAADDIERLLNFLGIPAFVD